VGDASSGRVTAQTTAAARTANPIKSTIAPSKPRGAGIGLKGLADKSCAAGEVFCRGDDRNG
jgi:hypothetical protein